MGIKIKRFAAHAAGTDCESFFCWRCRRLILIRLKELELQREIRKQCGGCKARIRFVLQESISSLWKGHKQTRTKRKAHTKRKAE